MKILEKVQISPVAYRRITFWTIVSLGAIVFTGVSVRLTGSGLGCPDWPNCNPQGFVSPWEYHAVIEQINRVFSGVVGVPVILCLVGSFFRAPRQRNLTWWSWGLIAGVGVQVLMGRWVVTSELEPWVVVAHFLLSMVLLWNAIVLHHLAKERDAAGGGLSGEVQTGGQLERGQPAHTLPAKTLPALLWAMSIVAGFVLVTGTLVTGSGPHGGDDQAERLNFDISNVARIHSIGVFVLSAIVLGIFWLLFRHLRQAGSLQSTSESQASPNLLSPVYLLMGVIASQGFVGYLQYFNDVPELLVGIHVVGSVSVWWAVLHAHLKLRESLRVPESLQLQESLRVPVESQR